MSGDPIKSSDSTIGWVTRTGCDNYWTIATFERGNDFDAYRDLIEATLAENDEDQVALDAVNDLNLTIGDPPAPIRDFQMTTPTTVEFKEAPWV